MEEWFLSYWVWGFLIVFSFFFTFADLHILYEIPAKHFLKKFRFYLLGIVTTFRAVVFFGVLVLLGEAGSSIFGFSLTPQSTSNVLLICIIASSLPRETFKYAGRELEGGKNEDLADYRIFTKAARHCLKHYKHIWDSGVDLLWNSYSRKKDREDNKIGRQIASNCENVENLENRLQYLYEGGSEDCPISEIKERAEKQNLSEETYTALLGRAIAAEDRKVAEELLEELQESK